MKPCRVVLVMVEPPVPFGNAAARWFYVLLRGLVERGHRVTALAACSKPAEIAKARDLFPAPEYDLRLFPVPQRRGLLAKLDSLRRPYSYMFSDELVTELNRVLANGYDVLHMEQLWAGWVGMGHAAKAVVNIHYLFSIDLGDVPLGGLRSRLERRLMMSGERRLLRHYPRIQALSDRLADRVRSDHPDKKVHVVPIGLDPTLYRYIPDGERTGQPVISLIGSMGWYPTRSAAQRLLDRLWPEIKQRVPEARLQIVGWNARSALAEYLGRDDVTVAENVPEIRPYFEGTGLMLYAPGRGSGMKIKVLEALAFGVPVVTTSEGVEGLPAEDGVHAGLAEDDEGLVARAVALLNDPAAQNRQRAAGRQLLESHCGPSATLDQVEEVYRQIVAPGRQSEPVTVEAGR